MPPRRAGPPRRAMLALVAGALLLPLLSGCILSQGSALPTALQRPTLDGGGLPGPGVPSLQQVMFRPPVFADVERSGGEPTVRVAADGTMWLCAPSGVGNLTASHLWRSDDDGRTFAAVPVALAPGLGNPFAGGDCDLALDAAGTLTMLDLWLGSSSIYATEDGGATWWTSPVAGPVPVVDRPWLAAGARPGELYLLEQQLDTGIWVLRSDDGGRAWLQATLAVPRYLDGERAGIMGAPAMTPDGALHFLYPSHPDGPAYWTTLAGACDAAKVGCTSLSRLYHVVSRDGGLTFERHLVADGRGDLFNRVPALASDAEGNLAAVWSEVVARPGRPEETHVFLSLSRDGGATWSAPRQLSGVPGHHVMPWVSAGGAGHVDVAWFGSPTPGGAWRTREGAVWYVYLAQLPDAFGPLAEATVGVVEPEPVHVGAMNRTLKDFLQVARTPDGRAVVGYADVAHGPDGRAYVRVAVQERGPTAPPPPPPMPAPASPARAPAPAGIASTV